MCYVIQEWEQVNDMAIHAAVLREESMAAHSITWIALAEAGLYIIQKLSDNNAWWHIMGNFTMDWSRQNPLWQGRAINGGKITKTRKNIILMANPIIQKFGIELNKVQQAYEDEFLKTLPTNVNAA
jgi:DNA sulfur modification protein DndB